ncbi:MAG: hypothetical protein ACKVP4_00910 [Hyphomicrobium sp.]
MIESAQITRWVVLVALSLATAVMFAVSIRGNYLFGYSLGQTDEKSELFGWANVAADVWKAFGLIAVTMLWRTKHRRAASVASMAWLMCLLFGINSALGIYVQDRAALTGAREATHATYKDAQNELTVAEGKLRTHATHRSTGEIDAAISAVLGRAVIAGDRLRGTVAVVSKNCTKIDMRTNEACREVAQLREEYAAATEFQNLEERASALRDQVIALRDRGGSIAPDPVGEFYAWITGGIVSVRDVGFGFPLFFALLIEVISAFGPLTIAAYAEATRASVRDEFAVDSASKLAVAGHDQLRLATAGLSEPQDGHFVSWIAERAIPMSGNSAIGIEELHADYAHWCAERGLRAGSIALFEDEFDRVRHLPDLAGKIRKFGDRYYGVGLVGRELRSIASGRSG